MRRDEPPRRHRVDPVQQAIAAVTAWVQDESELGRALAAEAVDRDPIAFLDAVGGLWLIVADVARESQVELASIVADVALGVAQAETETEGT
jgi:hypothetical protein